jgi:hypothetical protein
MSPQQNLQVAYRFLIAWKREGSAAVIREEAEVTALGHFSSGDDATHIVYDPSTNTNITERK